MSDPAPVVTVYADYVCPFCYLGHHSLKQYEATREGQLTVEWHPFDLRGHNRQADGSIDHQVDDGKDEAYFEQARQNVERLREEYGAHEMLDVTDVPDPVDSLDAQVASSYVQNERSDQWREFDDRIYEALWVDGRDIGDQEVLVDLAENVGIERADIRAILDDSEHRDAVQSLFDEAHQHGITGVPTFVADGYAARGAVPPEQLRRLIDGT